jgi:phosphopantetheinyl transferase (holo-ACP synthase)
MNRSPRFIDRWLNIRSQQETIASKNVCDWLSSSEHEIWMNMEMRSYPEAWLAGRWLGKSMLIELLRSDSMLKGLRPIQFRDISIISRDGRGCRNRPQVYTHGQLSGFRLSLAHSRSFVYAALCNDSRLVFGVDVADLDKPDKSFQHMWFSDMEQQAVSKRNRPWDDLRIWTAKEACYKACQHGEAFVPKLFDVRLITDKSGNAVYFSNPLKVCRIHWSVDDNMVRALAVLKSSSLPEYIPGKKLCSGLSHD